VISLLLLSLSTTLLLSFADGKPHYIPKEESVDDGLTLSNLLRGKYYAQHLNATFFNRTTKIQLLSNKHTFN
jgi:hypothetical protein